MKEAKTRQNFLELRAQGKSLRAIEIEIGTNRGTLAKWESECKEELENLRAMELEAMREEYSLTTQARIERFGRQLQRVTEELENRDLSDIPTPRLVDLAIKLDTKLREEGPTPTITSEAGLAARKANRQLVRSLGTLHGPMQSLKEGDRVKNGNGKVKGEDLVKLQVNVLQRYEAGEINDRTAANEIAIVNSIFKGIEIADLQTRLERIEVVLGNGRERALGVVDMGQAKERRLRAMMRKADARRKALLVASSVFAPASHGAPILKESEVNDLQQSLKTEDQCREFAGTLAAARSLFVCVWEAESTYREVVTRLVFLSWHFSQASEYWRFQELLNELCLKRDGDYNERLQERIVSTGKLMPYFYNIALQEESEGSKSISLQMSDADSAFVSEVIESLEQKASELKAVVQGVRDVIKQRSLSINAFVDSIDRFEKNVRERIHLAKRLLYDTDYEGWDERRAVLSKRNDPLLAMMEALADYDDIALDEARYDETLRSVNCDVVGA